MENSKRDIIRRAVVVAIVFGFIFILIGIILLSKMLFGVGVRCPFYQIWGWHCPGCGGTRMGIALLKGQLYQALRYNAYITVTLPAVVAVFIKQVYVYVMHNRLLKYLDVFLVVYTIGLVLFGIVRNVEMFSWLAPVRVI